MVAPSAKSRLELRRQLAAPPETVFDVWTQPEHMRNWFGPSPDYDNPFIEVDLRVGGKYRVGFQKPGDELAVVFGEFLEINRPAKLVYTWQWEPPNEHAGVDTQVTVQFLPHDGGTELVLTHERIADDAMRESHTQGWSGALDRLVAAVAALA